MAATDAPENAKVKHGAFRRGLIETATAFLFALCVAFVLAGLLSWNLRPVKLLQSWGVDIGLRVNAQPAWYRFGVDASKNKTFVFLDLSTFNCEAYLGSKGVAAEEVKEKCVNVAAPPPQLFHHLLSKFDEKEKTKLGPSVVLLDYRMPDRSELSDDSETPDDTETRDNSATPYESEKTEIDWVKELHDLLVKKSSPAEPRVPVIVPAGLDAIEGELMVSGKDKSTVTERWSEGRLRMAGYLTSHDTQVKDGILRGFPVAYNIDGGPGTTTEYLPSAPLLAALIAENGPDLSRADKIFYNPDDPFVCKTDDSSKAQDDRSKVPDDGTRNPDGCSKALEESVLRRAFPEASHYDFRGGETTFDPEPQRQVFSLFSLSIPDSVGLQTQQRRSQAERLRVFYHGAGSAETGQLYQRVVVGDFQAEDGNIDWLLSEFDFKDKIVVVGTSAVEAHDWHRTSLGDMAGPEVLINSTRAFLFFNSMNLDDGFVATFLNEALFAFCAAIGLLFFVCLREVCKDAYNSRWSAIWGKERSHFVEALPKLLGWAFYAILSFILLVLGVVFAFVAAIGLTSLSADATQSVDFLLPTLMVVFESSTEIAIGFFDVIRRLLLRFSSGIPPIRLRPSGTSEIDHSSIIILKRSITVQTTLSHQHSTAQHSTAKRSRSEPNALPNLSKPPETDLCCTSLGDSVG